MELPLVMHCIPLQPSSYMRGARGMWAAMGCIDRKMSWLKIMFDQHRQT
ncbi:hypothetical protein NC652_004725 [Populus alba x Populus x berolinensis]|nr:hypothetical protein NC652_004725 [Populus alba x Populus x berolinensis]